MFNTHIITTINIQESQINKWVYNVCNFRIYDIFIFDDYKNIFETQKYKKWVTFTIDLYDSSSRRLVMSLKFIERWGNTHCVWYIGDDDLYKEWWLNKIKLDSHYFETVILRSYSSLYWLIN